ncbi:thioredoxin fold domain-containing protein, partial [uncultured Helicobacter sp.]
LYEKEKAKINTKLKELFNDKNAQVFSFKAKKQSSKTIYIVSDPNCPYCQQEFANLSRRLEEANVKMLLVGFLGEDSMLKVANALKNKSGNQAKDIAMLSALYGAKVKGKAMDTKEAMALTQAVANVGVRSVPYIIE